MTATPAQRIGEVLLSASYRKEEDRGEGGFVGVFGQIAQRYFERWGDRFLDRFQVVALGDALCVPVVSAEAAEHVFAERQIRVTFDGDVIVVVDKDQLPQTQMSGKGGGF